MLWPPYFQGHAHLVCKQSDDVFKAWLPQPSSSNGRVANIKVDPQEQSDKDEPQLNHHAPVL